MLESRVPLLLTTSASPGLTHDFSASWRGPAAAVRRQEEGSPPPWDLQMPDDISPSRWMPTQGF